MSILLGVQSFLENSNENGFGFLTVVVLFYLFIFFLIQFFQHKKLFYLLYSLYALVNALNLLKYIDGVFFSNFFQSQLGQQLAQNFHFPSQLIGSILFTYFVVEIMQFRKEFKKTIRLLDKVYLFLSVFFMIIWAIKFLHPNNGPISFFHVFVWIPAQYVIFFWVFYKVVKSRLAIKWFILSGMTALAISYLILTLFSIESQDAKYETLYIFYIGILMESLLFALAIGLEQKMLYLEKAEVQKKYILQLEENQSIKESINRTLQDELLQSREEIENITAKAQLERTEKLMVKFENRFAQLRLDALRSQMNPHFIFNALNSIKSYFIENNREKAIFYLTKFSKLIRTILENSREDQITLLEELDTLKIYVAIESDRFDNNIEFEVVVDDSINAERVMVPALFLQPFVENSIWHGLSTKKGEKKIAIRVVPFKNEAAIQIFIEDNGVGRKESELKKMESPFKKQSIGLSLTADRLDLFTKKTGKPYRYEIVDLYEEMTGKGTGTKVIIELPEIYSK